MANVQQRKISTMRCFIFLLFLFTYGLIPTVSDKDTKSPRNADEINVDLDGGVSTGTDNSVIKDGGAAAVDTPTTGEADQEDEASDADEINEVEGTESVIIDDGSEEDTTTNVEADKQDRNEEGADENTTTTGSEKDEKKEGVCYNQVGSRPNLLFIVMDQLRYDTVGYAQETLQRYANALKIRTPNIDKVAADGAVFRRGKFKSKVG